MAIEMTVAQQYALGVILGLDDVYGAGGRYSMPKATLTKWGNSQGIIIPKSICEELHVKQGDELTLTVQGGELRIRPAKSYTIQALLADYDGPAPEPVDYWEGWGGPVGKEVW